MTLYELTKLPDNTLIDAIKDGRINSKMARKDVVVLRGIDIRGIVREPKEPKSTSYSRSPTEKRLRRNISGRSLLFRAPPPPSLRT
jgi:hypothetical protein